MAGIDPELEALAKRVTERVPAAILAIQRATGYPVFLRRDDRIGPDSLVRMNWTNTALAVLHVSPRALHDKAIEPQSVGRLLGLEQHAQGLPISTEDGDNAQLASGCLETVGLVRAWRPYREAMGTDESVLNQFLPDAAKQAAVLLCRTIDERDDLAMEAPLLKQGALLVGAGVFEATYREEVARRWPEIVSVVETILSDEPRDAASACWKWLWPYKPVPKWEPIPRREPARVLRPSVAVLGTIARGVLASDSVNLKGFALTVSDLEVCVDQTRARPIMYLDHDRSRPPALAVLEAHLSCDDGEHQVHIEVGAMTATGNQRLSSVGGFSVGITRNEKGP